MPGIRIGAAKGKAASSPADAAAILSGVRMDGAYGQRAKSLGEEG